MAIDSRIRQAFINTPRKYFLPENQQQYADVDIPLDIGFGQTNSQPTTVKMMLTWLNPKIGDKVLDVGSGSGWTTALLANMVGPKGKVYAVERITPLLKMGKNNCAKLGIDNAYFYPAKKIYGLSDHAPYNRILVSASVKRLSQKLLRQLQVNGRMVLPVKDEIIVIDKISQNKYKYSSHYGFLFVPLI